MKDRKEHWDEVYRTSLSTGVSWYQQEPMVSLSLIENCRVARDIWVIDVGGGTSNLVDNLLAKGYSNIGVLDISAEALLQAQQRLGSGAQKVQWFDADVTQFEPPHEYSIWHDRAVFHFLTAKEDREKYISTMKKTLIQKGHLIIAAFAMDGPSRCSGLDIIQYNESKLLAELGSDFELVSTQEESHLSPSNVVQKFVYYHLIRKF